MLNKSEFKEAFHAAVSGPYNDREDLIRLGMALVLVPLSKNSKTPDIDYVIEDLRGFANKEWS